VDVTAITGRRQIRTALYALRGRGLVATQIRGEESTGWRVFDTYNGWQEGSEFGPGNFSTLNTEVLGEASYYPRFTHKGKTYVRYRVRQRMPKAVLYAAPAYLAVRRDEEYQRAVAEVRALNERI
jgi:hypothetical protein